MGAMFYVEVSDHLNMSQGENSLMGELTVLLGVMTGGVTMVLNYWFNKDGDLPKESMMDQFRQDAARRAEALNEQRERAAIREANRPKTIVVNAPSQGNDDDPGDSNAPSSSSGPPPQDPQPTPSAPPATTPNKPTTSPSPAKSEPATAPRTAPLDEPDESVGASGNNLARDVQLIQSYLHDLGYLQDTSELDKVKGMPKQQEVPESALNQTIKAIKRYQLYGLGIQSRDGRIDPLGNSLRHMMKRMKMIQEYSSYRIKKSSTPIVLKEEQWISQFESVAAGSLGRGLKESEKARPGKPNKVCCWDTAQTMVRHKVPNILHNTPDRIPTIFQGDTKSTWILNQQAILGVKYIDREIEAGFPVFVGVDDGRTASYNADGTTEHYLVIVGKVVENGQLKYRFFDPGTRHGGAKGYASSNLLTLQQDHTLRGPKPGTKSTYTIAQVRQNDR